MSKSYKYTDYFENRVLKKRPYLTKEICVLVIENALRVEKQEDNKRIRFWSLVDELGGRAVRVVTLEDGETIHNAFIDRGFKE